ncbi:Arm DNA-binding domain-containing protein [Acinetobacter guillouiae]|uniref:Arm DNA-binding domain-containing protein n=1 Tax=Acinetobacter guillouiae TaxID=106649 RepID=UPI00315ADE96
MVFQFCYRFNGKSSRLDIGIYPHLSLKDARILVQKYKAELDQGKDPLSVSVKI